MTGGKLLALGGQINLASVASPGEVSAADFMPASGMTMGGINLSQDAQSTSPVTRPAQYASAVDNS